MRDLQNVSALFPRSCMNEVNLWQLCNWLCDMSTHRRSWPCCNCLLLSIRECGCITCSLHQGEADLWYIFLWA